MKRREFLKKTQAAPIESHYEVMPDYPRRTDAGRVIASGVRPAGAVSGTEYPEQACKLGGNI